MLEAAGNLGLDQEAPAAARVVGVPAEDLFESDLAMELGVEGDEVGVANAGSTVVASTPKPPKTAGEKIADEGEGGTKIAEYLVAQKLI